MQDLSLSLSLSVNISYAPQPITHTHARTDTHTLTHGVEPTTDPSCSAEAAEACRTINAMTLATTHNFVATARWPVSAQSLGDPLARGGDNGGDARNRCCAPAKEKQKRNKIQNHL